MRVTGDRFAKELEDKAADCVEIALNAWKAGHNQSDVEFSAASCPEAVGRLAAVLLEHRLKLPGA